MMRKLHVQFTEKNLTGNAGLIHLGRFAEKLGLDKMLTRRITIKRAENAQYEAAHIVMLLVMGALAGAKHLSHLVILKSDHALRALFRWENFPNYTTVSRIFKLFTPKHCKELSDVEAEARKKVWGKKWFRREVEIPDNSDTLPMFEGSQIRYDYFCYVVNMPLSPWATHKYYGKRATSENWIEWCKSQMASGSILVDKFWANSAIFQSCILAYNLMVWMMWLNDEKGFKEEPNTIRMMLIHVPARLKHAGRQWFLRLNRDYPFKERWQRLEASILSLNFT